MTQAPPNVLLVIADTVRADHLDLYGYGRVTSRHLSRRVASPGWTVFDRCYSTAGWTLPACASIITGQNPDRHGLVDHTRRFTSQKLAGALRPTHRTVGIGNNGNLVSDDIDVATLDSLGLKRRPKKWNHFGWNEGFDRYEWFPHDQHWKAINKACRLLDRWRDDAQPWFMMLHTNLAHDYNLDRPYYRVAERVLGKPLDPRVVEFADGPDVWNELAGEVPDLRDQIVAKYDSGLRRLDRTLDDVIARVDHDKTIVVVVSDHGEGFDPDLGRVHHCGRLHEDLLHVPLLVHTPPSVASPDSIPRRVRHARSVTDIVPTILRMTGVSSSVTFDGSDLFGPERHRSIRATESAYLYRPGETPIRRHSSDRGPVSVETVINHPLKATQWLWEPEGATTGQVNLYYDPMETGTVRPARTERQPVRAVTVVVDFDEYAHNLAASPDVRSGAIELDVIDNRDNRSGSGIGGLYASATPDDHDGPIVYVHPDVYLPDGWLDRMHEGLQDLTDRDPEWAVAGIAGRTRGSIDRGETGRGHWSDPHGYRRFGELPHLVDVVDELVIIVRDRSIGFDSDHPGFHCYGTDICATAHQAGRTVWVIDDFAWHKMRKSNGDLITHRETSGKITNRDAVGFSDEFTLSAAWVRDKWHGRQPLQGMTEYWRDFYGEG
ncbi:MAG: sulfatase-like hydrolase/transferase [Acidimicrobiales bacterium]